jgi:hypothetical protein
MNSEPTLPRARLTVPRAAAVAGILFSVLLIISLVLVRLSVPADPKAAGDWLTKSAKTVTLALNLVPFAGIAFLWFIGVIRDRLGEYEDKLFSTVFLGSGLMFLAMLFASAALAGSVIISYDASAVASPAGGMYGFGRAATYITLNTYAMRMAGVFMISTCTMLVKTGVMPRWMGMLGYALALILLLTISSFSWVSLVFPAWVFAVSVYILIDNFRRKAAPRAGLEAEEEES